MNTTRLAARLLPAMLLSIAFARAQEKAPPWWGVQDNVTVSLYWDFNAPFAPGQPPQAPTAAVVPSWYSPAVTGWTASPNVTWVPTLAGRVGVAGLVGNGTPQVAAMTLKVDNDPHYDWVKVFWVQFDMFEGSSGDIAKTIAEDLSKYGRAIVSETSEALGSGWQRVTIDAQLIPQPQDEDVDWTLIENAFGTVAIDDLFVSSKCVKPWPDDKGDALGKVVTTPINLTVQTGGLDCRAAVHTEGPSTGPAPRYWVSALAATAATQHQIFQFDPNGVVVGSPVLVPGTALSAPLGATDLALETRTNTAGAITNEFVHAIVDYRQGGGQVRIHTFDAHNSGALVATISLSGFPPVPQQPFGLAFEPSGNLGAGTFWVTVPLGTVIGATTAFEFSRSGLLLDSRTFPDGTVGLAYDDTLGKFYCFSNAPVPSPSGPVQVNGYEVSGYDFEPTGVRFCGNLNLLSPGTTRGGIASGIEAYRAQVVGGVSSELRLVCVAAVGAEQFLYELAGPFGYGYSRFGRCGMQNGVPFLGGSFDLTLTGVPTSALAIAFLGSSNVSIPIGVPPTESYASILPDVNSALLAPSSVGTFTLPISIPPTATLGYAPVFFQWVVLDNTAPGLIGFTQAGKTVLYP